MVKQIFILLVFCVLILGCYKEKTPHIIPFIKSLESIEKEVCFAEKMHIVEYKSYDNWESFLENMCECRKVSSLKDSDDCDKCTENWKNVFSIEEVPESILNKRPFILVSMSRRLSPDPECLNFNKICSDEPIKRFVFDAETYELIETPSIKKMRDLCNGG